MKPLAEKMRPKTFSDVIGQKEVVSYLESIKGQIPSLLLYGPPGSGKTTIARVIARESELPIRTLSAVSDGLPALRKILEESKSEPLLLFVDEIHRWNKSQQDALLPFVEKGQIILIGATTENPGYEINPALRSRMQLLRLTRLEEKDIKELIQRAARDYNFSIDSEAVEDILLYSSGDGRRALLLIDRAITLLGEETSSITKDTIQKALGERIPHYSRVGLRDEVVSAFIKSMRVGDTEGALFWLAKMKKGGEDPLFIARRMSIFASEDVGLADPGAIQLAEAVASTVQFIGEPECWISLSHGAAYLSRAPKSWAAYRSWLRAVRLVEEGEDHLPPPTVRKEKYIHPADSRENEKSFLPESLKGKIWKYKEDQEDK